VFVHGGHWQESSKEDSSFAAPGFVEAGSAFAAVGYGLAPEYSLPSMVTSVRRALDWLRRNAFQLGVEPSRIFVSGSSAGAHLVAAALSFGTEVAGATLLSGVYDLAPIRSTYVNDALGLDAPTAFAYSPLHHPPHGQARFVLARGEHETGEYARQHTAFAGALRAWRPVDLVVRGRNHFDLPFDLPDATTPLGAAVLAQMSLVP